MGDFDGEDDLQNCCWVCLGAGSESEPLQRVCACPSLVHAKCLARWNLHCAGKSEETRCRFCNNKYPDWKETLRAPAVRGVPQPAPVLSIFFGNQCARIKVRPGPEGLVTFKVELERILGRDINSVNLVFRCQCPETGAQLHLHGLQAWSAAIHCACIRAARRAHSGSRSSAAAPSHAHSSQASGIDVQGQRGGSRSSPGILSPGQGSAPSAPPSSVAASSGSTTTQSSLPSTTFPQGPYMMTRPAHAQPGPDVAAPPLDIASAHACGHPPSLMYSYPSDSRPQVLADPSSQSGSSTMPGGLQSASGYALQHNSCPAAPLRHAPTYSTSAGAGSWRQQQDPLAGGGGFLPPVGDFLPPVGDFLPPVGDTPVGSGLTQMPPAAFPSYPEGSTACVDSPLMSQPSPVGPSQYVRSNSMPMHPRSPAVDASASTSAAGHCNYLPLAEEMAPSLPSIVSSDSSDASALAPPPPFHRHGSSGFGSSGGADAMQVAPPSPPVSELQGARCHHRHRSVHPNTQQQQHHHMAADPMVHSAPARLLDPAALQHLPFLPAPYGLGPAAEGLGAGAGYTASDASSSPNSSGPSSPGSHRGTLMRSEGNTCLSDYQCCTNDDITLARVTSGTFASAHSSPATAPASPAVYGAPAVPGMNPKRPSTGGPAHSSSTSAAGTGGLASLVQTLPPIGKGQQQGGGKGNSSPSTAVQDARAASIIRRLRGFFRLRNMQHI